MNKISQIKDKKTREFSEACFNQNSIAELLNAKEPDTTDMKTWGITEAQWKEAIRAALAEKFDDEEIKMNAIEIIELVRANGAGTKEAILEVLEDGEALAALGITDADQGEVEDAYDMIKNTGLNFTLNEKGQKELLAEILEVANEKLINPMAYFAEAEADADRWNNDESPNIELNKKNTKSGYPEIIYLKKEWFDSEINY